MLPQLDNIGGRYLLESEISRGGMATVWQARDDVLARPVAVKILHPHLSEDHAFLERFRREALAAARLSHANIVSIYDTGTQPGTDGQPDLQYIVMERCSGGTLADILQDEGSLPAERVVSIGHTICDALGYAHRQGIVHRDVKPANVLLADDGSLKVADFGIAKAAFVKDDLTTTGSILGTVTYLSPEQGEGKEPDHRSDIYGLGVVLYELMVGRPPFAAETQIGTALMHIKEPPPPLRSIKAGISRPVEAAIMRALEKEPERRYASADEMGNALLSAVGRAGGTTALPMSRPSPRSQQHPATTGPTGDTGWLIKVILGIAAVIAVALLVSSAGGDDATTTDGSPDDGGEVGAAASVIEVREVADFDPYGGDGEHPEEAPAAIDGDRSSAWTTQTYSSDLETIGKPGVGLLLDLGESTEVSEVRISGSPGMDIEVRAADSVGADETDFEVVASRQQSPGSFKLSFDPTEGRYWVVWITRLSADGGGTASIAEVEFRG